jgi:putative pyruvate formate lyase activating enzyme
VKGSRATRRAGFEPGYRRLLASGELQRRAAKLEAMLECCELCPRRCGVNRRRELGRCFTGGEPVVASWGPHLGEEPPLSGTNGSGTIFLANCNLRCAFCQNADISQRPADHMGRTSDAADLAAVMLQLEADGCHNVNWVSPTHQVAALVRALVLAAENGLSVPIVYNTNGYDSLTALELLDGVVDIYMPDLKYSDELVAQELSGIADYPSAARVAVAEMFRQVGESWELGPDGTLRRGLLVRVLILPADLAGVAETLRWLSETLSPRVTVSLMSQYRPCHRAGQVEGHPELRRSINREEHAEALLALERFNKSRHTMVQRAAGMEA